MSASSRVVVHEAELQGVRHRGRHLRAYCHLHGSDRQRSLSVNVENGFGECFSCHAQVFVPEFNPEGAMRAPAPLTAARLLQPPRPRPPHEPAPEPWQRGELATLERLAERMRARLSDERARAYLEGRGIPYDIAAAVGVGYVPPDAKLSGSLAKWRDRLIFPLGSPAGRGYAGRSLWGWVPGMDENVHKALLEATPDAPRRWEKTYPAGWFNFDALATAETAVLVEGPVDLLALLAAGMEGMPGTPVVALVGTAGRAEWITANVRRVVLALDGDQSGGDAAKSLARDLTTAGVAVRLCVPTSGDGYGKDWAERWRRGQWKAVYGVFDALDVWLVEEGSEN
jgi:DNA primase